MCGISAAIRKSTAFSAENFLRMNGAIVHRGPDGEGVRYFNTDGEQSADGSWQLALGHRRLSILDLTESGSQPMSYDNGRYWITYNGECYNYVELKDQLTRIGYHFGSSSDTEVILAAYKAWGTACFEKMRGMWALCLYDVQKHELVICRDRLGIKPLYYHVQESQILFFSEIKQVVNTGIVPPKANLQSVKNYFNNGFEKSYTSFFENIYQVPSGTYIQISLKEAKKSIQPQSYWNPEQIEPVEQTRAQSSEQFRELFFNSVHIHLRSDVPVGCQLSGGMDSSSIIMAMHNLQQGSENISTFSSIFPGYERSEDTFINSVLRGIKADAHFSTPTPEEFISDLNAFVCAHDEPVGSFSQYASYRLAKLTQEQGIKVVFNGQGGDEMLGGYWQIYYAYLFKTLRDGNIFTLFKHVFGAALPGGNYDFLQQFSFILKRYVNRKSVLKRSKIRLTLTLPEEDGFLGKYLKMSIQEKRLFEIRELILPRLLKWDDRNLMAFSIEGRYPLLDHLLIEACLRMPIEHMYDRGWTKYPLREAMKPYLPKEIYKRKSKWGYELPKESWMRNQIRPLINNILQDSNSLTFGILNHNDTTQLVYDFLNGNDEEWQTVYRLINFHSWIKQMNVIL
jgi:asparagine synthase (glutamine-hydrolysing)